jgi:HEAT repeat protein
MGLGKKRTEESFAALLQMMKFDRDPNVRAEAANSLSMFGSLTVPHLVAAFYQDDSWLVRRSILAALIEFNSPNELFEVCSCGVNGEDLSVQEASVEGFGLLCGTPKQEEALSQLLLKVKDPSWRIRAKVAKALSRFSSPQVQAALQELKQDEDYRVVSSVLEQSVE